MFKVRFDFVTADMLKIFSACAEVFFVFIRKNLCDPCGVHNGISARQRPSQVEMASCNTVA